MKLQHSLSSINATSNNAFSPVQREKKKTEEHNIGSEMSSARKKSKGDRKRKSSKSPVKK